VLYRDIPMKLTASGLLIYNMKRISVNHHLVPFAVSHVL
jgi:hypothetical protein